MFIKPSLHVTLLFQNGFIALVKTHICRDNEIIHGANYLVNFSSGCLEALESLKCNIKYKHLPTVVIIFMLIPPTV